MNEKEVKDAARERRSGGSEARCSVTGRACKCDARGGCQAQRTSVDRLPNPLVHRLKTLALHLEVAKDDCDWCTEFDEMQRIWPQPEIRDIRRKLETAQSLLREILGEERLIRE